MINIIPEGKVVTINQEITFEEAEEIAIEYDIICEKEVKVNEVEELLKEEEEDPATMVKRLLLFVLWVMLTMQRPHSGCTSMPM